MMSRLIQYKSGFVTRHTVVKFEKLSPVDTGCPWLTDNYRSGLLITHAYSKYILVICIKIAAFNYFGFR